MLRHVFSQLCASEASVAPAYRLARLGGSHLMDGLVALENARFVGATAGLSRLFSTTAELDGSHLVTRLASPSPPERTRRSGVIAIKAGMTQEWDHWGARIPLTVLWIDDCQVVQVKRPETDGYLALQLGCGSRRPKQIPGSLRGHFYAAGIPLKRKLAEFKVTEDAVLPVGSLIMASHFVPGQLVDVTGTTIGKGFQGVMKRWGFAGQPASHGNSLSHRAPGSTGGCQDPGKVFKGKKLPGRMGGKRRTVQNCLVWRVDPVRGLIYVRGQVPGHKGNFLLVKDAVRMLPDRRPDLPLPTCFDGALDVTVAPKGRDPYSYAEQ